MEEVTINPTLPELTHDWGNRLLGGTNRTCAHQDPEERNSDPQETDPDLPMSVQESLVEGWVDGGLLPGLGSLSAAVYAGNFLKEVPICSLPPA